MMGWPSRIMKKFKVTTELGVVHEVYALTEQGARANVEEMYLREFVGAMRVPTPVDIAKVEEV